jgi:hypothetical protein
MRHVFIWFRFSFTFFFSDFFSFFTVKIEKLEGKGGDGIKGSKGSKSQALSGKISIADPIRAITTFGCELYLGAKNKVKTSKNNWTNF